MTFNPKNKVLQEEKNLKKPSQNPLKYLEFSPLLTLVNMTFKTHEIYQISINIGTFL